MFVIWFSENYEKGLIRFSIKQLVLYSELNEIIRQSNIELFHKKTFKFNRFGVFRKISEWFWKRWSSVRSKFIFCQFPFERVQVFVLPFKLKRLNDAAKVLLTKVNKFSFFLIWDFPRCLKGSKSQIACYNWIV